MWERLFPVWNEVSSWTRSLSRYIAASLERWPSGWRRTPGTRVYGQPYQGFESLSLRHWASWSYGVPFVSHAIQRDFKGLDSVFFLRDLFSLIIWKFPALFSVCVFRWWGSIFLRRCQTNAHPFQKSRESHFYANDKLYHSWRGVVRFCLYVRFCSYVCLVMRCLSWLK